MFIDFSGRNNAWSGKKAHVRDERLGCSPVAPGTVEPLPQVPGKANCLRHARPKPIPGETTFEDESSCEKALQEILGILLGPYRFQQAEDLVLVVCATCHTPGKEWQFARLQFVEYVNENWIIHDRRTTKASRTPANWNVRPRVRASLPQGVNHHGDAAR